MKAIVQDRYGSPEVLQAQEIDKPMIGDSEVRVHAASIHVGAGGPGERCAQTGG